MARRGWYTGIRYISVVFMFKIITLVGCVSVLALFSACTPTPPTVITVGHYCTPATPCLPLDPQAPQ